MIPTVGGSYEVTGNALQLINMLATALRTYFQVWISILISAVHATVTIVVHRTITHIQLVHHIYNIHDNLWVVSGITVDFNIEDVTTTSHFVVWSLYFRLMTG